MNFDLILEYQKLDQDINSLNAKINASEEAKKYAEASKLFEEDKVRAKKLVDQGNSLMASFAALQEKIEELKASLDEYDGIAEEIQDVAEAEYHLKHVNEICAEVASVEKELASYSKKIDEINEQYTQVLARGKKELADCEAARKAGQAFAAPFLAEIKELKTKRDALVPSIDAKVLESYDALRKTQKLPVIVQYKGTPGCPRCGMSLENETRLKLKNPGDHVECPHCRRILFIPEN